VPLHINEQMKTNNISHQAITASAGSGKTFQLAHRYIRLMANGVKPDRIIALTFSRKAAGEIFDSIVKYLREAASSPEQARKTADMIGKPQFSQGDFLHLLRALLDSLHRLHVGTLDSFTIGIIRAFPMELGISTGFQVMDSDGAQAKTARQEVLERIFNNRFVNRGSQREFLEAFKQATYGQEEKSLDRSLDTFISEYRSYYQILPTQDVWGTQEYIWPIGSMWLGDVGDIVAIADRLETLLQQDQLPENMMTRWSTFLDAIRTFGANSPWTRDIEYLAQKLFENADSLHQGNATIRIDRAKCVLSAEASNLALALLIHVMKTELSGALQKTRGIYRVLDQYEKFYEEMIRRRGKLTFSDAQYLLTPANSDSGGALISRLPDVDSRLYIDYRLDCKLDHWLLDEFQDTSDLQWEVLRNLADEILQDSSGQRSFFYVGDVKQAIYGWRGGNARLFGKILERYGDQIEQYPMNTSFRSCQPIIDTVNGAFTNLPSELPSGTIAEWAQTWQEHRCQEGFVPQHGYAAILEPPCHNGEIKPSDEDRYRVVGHLLKEIDPLNHGLSTAILVRSNENGKRVVNLLRQECPGMKIVHEGRASIKDNPVVSLLLSLVKFAAHPGDMFAWRHLEMSPLWEYFVKKGLDRNTLSAELLREIQQGGFKALIRTWGSRLDAAHRLDDFGRMRLENLINAAAEFDVSGNYDCNSFLHFIGNYQIHELATDDAVRVMTIHQSKGLGFDIVILPDLQGRSMTNSGDLGLITARDPITNHPIWALKMPRRLIAQNDPTLALQITTNDEAACFDALCVLYVALTRAKQALYMVTSYPGKTSQTLSSANFLKMQLCGESKPKEGPPVTIDGEEFTCLFEIGERDWYTKTLPKEQVNELVEPPGISEDFRKQPSHRTRFVRVSPSEQAEHEQNAASLFEHAFYENRDFGTAIHDLFEQVKWSAEVDADNLIEEWNRKSSAEEEFKQKVSEQFRQALASPEVIQSLARPEGNVELWRERHFEIILDEKWVTGTFDRVVILQDTGGNPLKATITDFKSDEIGDETDLQHVAQRYHRQLLLYKKALSHMLRLDPSRIELKLLFTHPCKAYQFH
jgi:ATP-dependent helicase/nuclease subunit A